MPPTARPVPSRFRSDPSAERREWSIDLRFTAVAQ